MQKSELIKLSEDQIPTVVSYSLQKNEYSIGTEARASGLKGITNAYNFKKYLGQSEKEFTSKKYWIAPSGFHDRDTKVISAKEAAKIFIEKTLTPHTVPDKVVIGVPAIPDPSWAEKYRANIRDIFTELEMDPPEFFHEPLAIYNSYKKASSQKNALKQKEDVLIIDIGGSTFNSCIVRSKKDGNIHRSGSYSVPLGINADFDGGSKVDQFLLEKLISRISKNGVEWKEDPMNRALSGKKPTLMLVEDAKIEICKKLLGKKLHHDCSKDSVELTFPPGWLHHESEISTTLNGNDIKEIVIKIWEKEWLPIIENTISDANEKINSIKRGDKDPIKISKIICAGGSSNLPFLPLLIYKAFADTINPKGILKSQNLAATVATGLAYECKYQSDRQPSMMSDKLAPCLLNELYFGIRKNRNSPITPVKVLCEGSNIMNGRLILSPYILYNYQARLTIETPFPLEDKIFYCFSNKPFGNETECQLNLSNDIAQLPFNGKAASKAKIDIEFNENGYIKCNLYVKGKGERAKSEYQKLSLPEFELPNLHIREGSIYYGFDFGNSNSYLVKVHTKNESSFNIESYPSYIVNKKTKNKLHRIHEELEKSIFEQSTVIAYADRIKAEHVYHSNKIEQIEFSKGETQKIIEDENPNDSSTTEVRNLGMAYAWMTQNSNTVSDSPENFIRELNRLLLTGVTESAGEYRFGPVRIGGAKITPPNAATVPALMQELAEEIRTKKDDRSPLEFAVSMHTKFVFIHPFEDGNGRTARLLLNCLLLNSGLPPMIVSSQNKDRYIKSLDNTSSGDISELILFFIDEFQSTLSAYKSFANRKQKPKKDTPQKDQSKIKNIDSPPVVAAKPRSCDSTLYESILHMARYCANKFLVSNRDFNVSIEDYSLPSCEYLSGKIDSTEKIVKWYFVLEMTSGSRSEKFLFYFDFVTPQMYGDIKLGSTTLNIARYSDGAYDDLSIEPITMRDLSSGESNIFISPHLTKLKEESFSTLLTEIKEAYF